MNDETPKPGVKRRGFASMSPERRRESAALGGKSVPSDRRAFAQDHSLAREAGSKGGSHSHARKKETQ